MCGLIGRFGAGPAARAIAAGLRALAHRGPDGSGTWADDVAGVALGHARLAVIDLAGGAQPIANEDGSIVAVVNGELYDFEARRAELEARGHRFATRSDSELLVHLYEERGLDCFAELRGELACLLWDGRKRRLIAARDRFGVKPLVYAHHAGALWLASEAKALFAAGVPARWDPISVGQALAHQYHAPARTLFAGVAELPPACLLVTDATGIQVASYFDGTPREQGPVDERDVIEQLRASLVDAVATRCRADVPIAAYLSGGLDSSLVVALAAQRTPVTAFGIAFDHAPYDEHRDAAAFAAELGIAFHPVRVSQDSVLDLLPEAVAHTEGLCINGQLAAKWVLARAVRDAGFKVVLAGEGADEVCYGYAHLVADHAVATGERVEPIAMQQGIMLPLGPTHGLPTWLAAKREIGLRMRALLVPAAAPDPNALLDEVAPGSDAWHPVDRAAYTWTRLALAKYILRTLGDGTEMAAGVEGRLPFLDHHVVAAARRAGPAAHLRGGVAKRLLREAARGLVPERIRTRPKQPLLAPPITVFSSARAFDLIRDVARGAAVRSIPWFDRDAVIAYVDALPAASLEDRRAAEPVVMTLLSMCALHQRYRLGVA